MRTLLPRFVALVLASTVTVATPAAAEWREATSDHFVIYADGSEDYVRRFAERLERFDSAMRIVQKIPSQPGDSANRVVVYIPGDLDAVKKLYTRNGVTATAGFYLPRMNSVAFVPRASASSRSDLSGETILFHEYAHHLMWRNATIAYPKWYSEGFAEMTAAALIGSDGRVEIGRHAGQRAYSLLNTSSLTAEKLIAGETNGNSDLFYGRSWLLTHLLTFDKARSGQLDRYLTLMSGGTANLDAARQAFGDLRALDRDIDRYMDRPLTFRTIAASRIVPGKVEVRVLGAGEAAMMPVRMRSDRGVDADEAKAVLVEARRRSAPYPNDPAVQVALAEAEFDAGNDAEAEAAADRAIAADPKNVDALLYKGQVLERRAGKADRSDAEAWRQARSWYIKAAAARPDAVEPLARFHGSFQEQGIAPTKNAADALVKAFSLAPQDRTLRFQAARQMLREGQTAEARRMLVPLAFDPHERGQSGYAAKLVTMIDAGEPAARIVAEPPPPAAAEGDGREGKAGTKK